MLAFRLWVAKWNEQNLGVTSEQNYVTSKQEKIENTFAVTSFHDSSAPVTATPKLKSPKISLFGLGSWAG
jgi:hypothetical protein